MRISGISHRLPAFSGRKILYTDFDKTYFPFVRSEITQSNSEAFKNMYLPFIDFKNSQGDDFELNITTGRSGNDYSHTQNLIQKAGCAYCYPNKVVSSNGANVFKFQDGTLKCISPKENSKAQGAVESIMKSISDLDKDIAVVECRINGDKATYQEYSSEGKLDKIKPEKYISIARDGKYNAEIVVSKKMDFDMVGSLVRQQVKENNLPFSVEQYENAIYTKGYEYASGEKTEVDANVIFLKYSPNGKQTDKFDIIKQEVKELQRKGEPDDYVIVAGDGFNDEKMLNPLNYIDGDKDIENPETLAKLSKLPLRAIVCGDDPALDNLRTLSKELGAKGVEIIKIAPDSKTDFIKAIKEFEGDI